MVGWGRNVTNAEGLHHQRVEYVGEQNLVHRTNEYSPTEELEPGIGRGIIFQVLIEE